MPANYYEKIKSSKGNREGNQNTEWPQEKYAASLTSRKVRLYGTISHILQINTIKRYNNAKLWQGCGKRDRIIYYSNHVRYQFGDIQ